MELNLRIANNVDEESTKAQLTFISQIDKEYNLLKLNLELATEEVKQAQDLYESA